MFLTYSSGLKFDFSPIWFVMILMKKKILKYTLSNYTAMNIMERMMFRSPIIKKTNKHVICLKYLIVFSDVYICNDLIFLNRYR